MELNCQSRKDGVVSVADFFQILLRLFTTLFQLAPFLWCFCADLLRARVQFIGNSPLYP
jgi:hypothetical protein